MSGALSETVLADLRRDPTVFIEQFLINPDTGASFQLLPAERAFLKHVCGREL
jgi:hypothetical protein